MFSNEFVVILLSIFITLLIVGLIIVIIYSVNRARKISKTTIYNPRELEVHYYRRISPESKVYERFELEEMDDRNILTGVALYGEHIIEFYLDDKTYDWVDHKETK